MNIERLKKRKKELGWTLDEIAERSGISRRTVSRLFSGNPNYPSPTINTLQAIERALGLDKGPEWTEEEKALGVGNYPVKISDDEYKWLELRSELLRVMGEDYVKTTESLLQAIIEKKDEKS